MNPDISTGNKRVRINESSLYFLIFFFKYYTIEKHVCDITDLPVSLKQVAILIKRTPIKLLQ